jgi:GT2 family glycosyltransferase
VTPLIFAPFMTFYTPTYRRPQALAACLASVQAQTAVASIEHIVIPDHVGLGVGGMYQRVPFYANAVHGKYVHVLADDDILVSPTVVEEVLACAVRNEDPEVIIVKSKKGNSVYPTKAHWPPAMGYIDLGCIITRRDVWRRHVQAYGHPGRYEGDFDFADAVWQAGHKAVFCDLLFVEGGIMRGAAETA